MNDGRFKPALSHALAPMNYRFDHERLNVYHGSISFVGIATKILQKIPKGLAVHNQLDRASTAIPLTIAEGSGKYTAPDRCRFYDMARGSALECAACLDVLVAKELATEQDVREPKQALEAIVSMLVGLIKAVAPNRIYEESPKGVVQEKVKEQD